jgi:hypothetical protein
MDDQERPHAGLSVEIKTKPGAAVIFFRKARQALAKPLAWF